MKTQARAVADLTPAAQNIFHWLEAQSAGARCSIDDGTTEACVFRRGSGPMWVATIDGHPIKIFAISIARMSERWQFERLQKSSAALRLALDGEITP